MSHTSRFLTFALISIFVAGSGLAASEENEVHFCQDADGSIVLQTDPCPDPIELDLPPLVYPPKHRRRATPKPIPEPATR